MEEKKTDMAVQTKAEAAGPGEKQEGWFSMDMDSGSRNEAFARTVAAVFASRLDPTLEELEDIRTAVSEAVTNAVIHGYGNGTGRIHMEACIRGKEFVIQIQDEGAGIPDVEKAMEPMYTTDTTGERSGMGFAFMEAFMDRVEVRSRPGEGTTVLMTKRIGR